MIESHEGLNRRGFLKNSGMAALGAIAAPGVYEVLDQLAGPTRAVAAPPAARRQEQYLVDGLEVIMDNGVSCVIPPIHNDVITAKLSSRKSWTVTGLRTAQTRLENALALLEKPYPGTAAGLTFVIGWGLPYFRNFLPAALWQGKLPVDVALSQHEGATRYAVLDAIRFPSDPTDMLLEDNHVMIKVRTDDPNTQRAVESALFDNSSSNAFIGDLFDVTSKRVGFLGRGFGTTSVAKQLALAAGVPGANQIPDRAQLMMGFTSTQTAALGPSNVPSFETLKGVTDQYPSGYFAGGCAMHLSHLFEDLVRWYTSFGYSDRVARMFSPHTAIPSDPGTVTLSNGPADISSLEQLRAEATTGVVGHNASLQQASRLAAAVTDNYGRTWPKGTPVPLREDFNTIDNPFARTSDPTRDRFSTTGAAGMHFVAFTPASSKFHAARNAMDGVLPDGTNLRSAYSLTDSAIGINAAIRASHRQNYLIPPRAHRSFPLAELLR
jgi:hypothetical protein